MVKAFCVFARQEEGVTAIEYALIALLIALAVLTAVGALGNTLTTMWSTIRDEVVAALSQ